MSRSLWIAVLLVAAAAGGAGGGYWFAQHRSQPSQASSSVAAEVHAHVHPAPGGPQAERRILYYKDPRGRPDFSPVPKKDEMGQDYIPVHEGEEEGVSTRPAPPPSQPAPAAGERKILYYRNPMGLPDVSPVPKKDSMGMDYIPVYEGEDSGDGSTVAVSLDRVQRLGVRTETVSPRALGRVIRAAATVQFDERRLAVIAPRFEGWIEKLHLNATGAPVRRGQVLMEVYSPEVAQAEQEYVLAATRQAASEGNVPASRIGTETLIAAALDRLSNLAVPEEELQRLQRQRTAKRTITLRSPITGLVVEKAAVAGMRFMAGEPLYRIADTSRMWLIAEVFEQDLGQIAIGQPAKIMLKAFPGRLFEGRIAFVSPTLNRETRSVQVRIEIANPADELKADMYATVELAAAESPTALAVPESAVIDSGRRQVVLVERGGGRYEPRAIRTGARGDGYIEVLDGLQEGETVVVSATFLIDAESNLQAALRAFTAGEMQPGEVRR
jgi:Cu(I)/Ag(I) efflux system membrane fusion protein